MFHPDISLGSTSYFTGQESTIYSWLNQLVWARRKVQSARRALIFYFSLQNRFNFNWELVLLPQSGTLKIYGSVSKYIFEANNHSEPIHIWRHIILQVTMYLMVANFQKETCVMVTIYSEKIMYIYIYIWRFSTIYGGKYSRQECTKKKLGHKRQI